MNGVRWSMVASRPGVRSVEREVHVMGPLPSGLGDDDGALRWLLEKTSAHGQRLTGLPVRTTAGDRDESCSTLSFASLHEELRSGGEAADYVFDRLRVIRALRREFREVPPYLVRIPLPWMWALHDWRNGWSGWRDLLRYERFVVAEVQRIVQRCGSDVVVQLAMSGLPELLPRSTGLMRLMVLLVARQVEQVRSAVADGVLILHVCPRTELTPVSMGRVVWFLNELVRVLGKRMPFIHLGLTVGDQPPPADRAVYEPLVNTQRDLRFLVGLVSDEFSVDAERALFFTEAALRQPVLAVGTACGLPDRGVSAAERHVDAACQLAQQGWETWPW